MFGYVKAFPPELLGREADFYRGVYCGLCRAQGRCTGQCSRAALNYDLVFMALTRMALEGTTPVFTERRCPIHPMHKRPMLEPQTSLNLTALASAVLTYHKVADDRVDETGMRRLRANLLLPLISLPRRRAMVRYADGTRKQHATDSRVPDGQLLDTRVTDCMKALAALEARKPPSVDEPAELFGSLLGDILSWGLTDSTARLGREIGLHVGRWVYILDAADDYCEDVRHGRYNPFVCLYGAAPATLPESRLQEIHAALMAELDAVVCAVDLVDIADSNLSGVLRNILYHGMPHVARSILLPEETADTTPAQSRKSKLQKGKSHT